MNGNIRRMRRRPARWHQAGFTLIEALLAMLVMAFGMLAIAAMQGNLSRASDTAKQRTEATRLAQQKMEELRSFERLLSASGKFAYADLANGSDATRTIGNMSFGRAWTVSGTVDDQYRTVTVSVNWVDRAGQAQTLALASVVSKSDPADAGGLALPPIENGILRRPKGRDINIPIPAIKLGGENLGKSTLQWQGPSGGWLVFSDVSGDVIFKCTTQPNNQASSLTGCTQLTAYLLVGYINGAWLASVTGATMTNTQYMAASPECVVGPAYDQSSQANPPPTISGYLAYACLIQPSDHDSNAQTPMVWSGKVVLQPAPTGNQKVCRYNGNATNVSGVHLLVTESLDNQNYQVISNGNCATGLTQHQP